MTTTIPARSLNGVSGVDPVSGYVTVTRTTTTVDMPMMTTATPTTTAAPSGQPKPELSFNNIPARVVTMKKEEYETTKKRLEDAGFGNISHFPAVVGKEKKGEITGNRGKLSYRAETEIIHANSREAHSSMPSWGAVGCYLSHVALWEEAARSKNGILVFEADVKPVGDARKKFEHKFSQLVEHRGGRKPDLFFLGGFGSPTRTSVKGLEGVGRLTDRKYGTEAYYVSPEGAKKLLQHAFPMEVQVDSYIGYQILRDAKKDTESSKDPTLFEAFIVEDYLTTQENLEGSSIQTKPVKEASIFDNEVMVWFARAMVLVIVIFGFLFIMEYRRLYWSKN